MELINSKVKKGDVGYAEASRRGAKFVTFSNDVGGTEFLPPGLYKVKIVHGFHDDETGNVLHAHLLAEDDIATAIKIGTTGLKPADYKEESNLYKSAVKAAKTFMNPPIVRFHDVCFKGPISTIETP